VKPIHDPFQTLITPKPPNLLTCLRFQVIKYGKRIIKGFGLVLEIVYGIDFEGWSRWAFLENVWRSDDLK
jgi:hypothetical protein